MNAKDADRYAYVLITGSRSYTDRATVFQVLNNTLLYRWPLAVMHGDCAQGPDRFASEWVNAHQDTKAIEIRRPVTGLEWGTYGSYAGPRRNQAMVDEMATLMDQANFVRCLAFIGPCVSPICRRTDPHDSHGASGCADMAEQAGIFTTRYHLPSPEAVS